MIQQRPLRENSISLRKFKNNLTKQEYSRLYPSGSTPGKFYGTAKWHKQKNGGSVDDVSLRPIISSVGTALYQMAVNSISIK